MHIPDGYLGPITCVAGYAAMAPLWAVASIRVRKTLRAKQVPLLAIAAAFSFVIMMFNIPIPGGTTGHAAGSVLAAILLGPWAACIAVSVALVMQALLFGDGGVTTIGANCFNMAFAMPFAGYAVYRIISGSSPATSGRRVIAAGIGGYLGLLTAALLAGIEFGLQPLIHHTASGQSLYCPYGLKIAVSTMVGEHALIFGWVELIATALVVKYLQKQEPALLRTGDGPVKTTAKLWIGLGILAALSPVGLYLPELLKAGPAWGEWGADEIRKLSGYIPDGLEKLSRVWNALIPDYAFKGWSDKGLGHQSFAYIVSATAGIALCIGAAWLLGKFLTRKEIRVPRNTKPNGKAGGFIEHTIMGVVSLLKETVSNDEIASRAGFLQRGDPRLKTLSIAFGLACVLSTRSVAALGVIYALTLGLAVASAIPLRFFLKRTLLFIPLFSLFIVLPALFNAVTPGTPVVSFSMFSHSLSITKQGIDSSTIFFMRVLASVSLAVLLVLTTRHHVLLKVLRIFKVPQLFVMTMGMTYRYIYLLLDIVQNTFTAIRSRVGFVTSAKDGRRIAAANIAGLWLKSYRMQTQVYNAMLARGYTGEPKVLDDFRARATDYLMLAGAISCLIGTLWLNLFFH